MKAISEFLIIKDSIRKGRVAERLNAPVLKTGEDESPP